MGREYEPSYKSSSITVTSHRGTIEPGQASRSVLMCKPEHAIASGLIQQKRWPGSAVSRHAVVQMNGDGPSTGDIHELAARGISGSATTLPFLENIQRSFGAHDVSGIETHVGGPASQACHDIGALAYATGNHVAFRQTPDLHTAAHEAAHIVQQRAGVQLANGVGQEGDEYERHADLVADAVVAGRSAEALLGGRSPIGQRPESADQAEQTGFPQKKPKATSDNTPCPKCGSGNCSCARPPTSMPQHAPLQQLAVCEARTIQRVQDEAKNDAATSDTVEPDIASQQGEHAPDTEEGRRLLAHELPHVVQQTTGAAPPRGLPGSGLIQRQVASGTPNSPGSAQQPQPTAPTQQDIINQARLGAFARCQIAYQRLAGIGPPPPPGRPNPAPEQQRRARNVARTIFGQDLNMDQVTEIVGSMRSRLTPGLTTVTAPANDPNCRNRDAYVVGLSQPVHLCPAFFSSSGEDQIRTMIHEAAHLAGIGEVDGESYCPTFDCQSSCGGFDVADSWAHFVHCLSGQAPDEPDRP